MTKQLKLGLYEPIFVGVIPDKRLKTCRCCGEKMNIYFFGIDRRASDNHKSVCRMCEKKLRRIKH